jgi:peptide/nickel transport system substrate-binding protein
MPKAVVALLAAVALLLAILILDRWRQPAQLQAVMQAAERAATAQERMLLELKAMREELARRPAATAAAAAEPASSASASAGQRDGKPRLGANFLKPYDRSHFHPAWVGGTLRDFNETPKGFNPIVENSSNAGAAQNLVNDSLCMTHPASPQLWSECLAEAVVVSDDWKIYTFRLRPGVLWQRPVCARQGEYAWLDRDVPLTASDFVFYVEMVKNAEVECPQLKSYYDDLERAEAPDDLTLVLRWKKKVFTSMTSSFSMSPLPRHIYARNRDGSPIAANAIGTVFNKHWFDDQGGIVGVGGYILELNESDKLMRFRRNPSYWGAPLHFDAIEWDAEVKLPDPQLVAFKNGQVHSHGLTPTQWKSQILDGSEPRFAKVDPANPTAGRGGELGWEKVKSHAYSYIGWNLRRPIFADKRTRQALAHAMPKQRLIDEVWFGLGRPQIGPIHLDNPYFNTALTDFAFDPGKAKALLAAAGWSDSDGDGWLDREIDGKRVALRIKLKFIANRPTWEAGLLVYRDELKRLGVDLQTETYEWKELLRIYEEKDFDAVVGGWSLGELEPDFVQIWHSSTADQPRSSNHVGFKNARVDELAMRLRETFEPEARAPIITEIQAIIFDEQPYLFFMSSGGVFVWQNHGKPAKDRWLAGVTDGFDAYHPLFNRTQLLWHFGRE